MTGLDQRCVLVTGAARGIGLGIAEVLLDDGAKVVLADLPGSPLVEEVERLRDLGHPAQAVHCDVTDERQVTALVSQAEELAGPVAGLVNNAGIVHVARFQEHTLADWERLLRVNVLGTVSCCRAVLPGMQARGAGSIVNIGSIASLGYTTSHAAYAASKAAINALSRELAVELMADEIRVNTVLPGFILTSLSESVSASSAQGLAGLPASDRPIADRWGSPADVGHLVSYLVSDASRFISGASITASAGSDVVIAGS